MQSNIERQVMGRVAVIYTARTLLSRTALSLYVLAGSAWAFGTLVWVARVQENFLTALQGGFSNTLNFLLVAISNTTLLVQLVLVVATVALVLFAKEVLKTATTRHPAF